MKSKLMIKIVHRRHMTQNEGIGQAEAVGLSDPTAPQNVCPQI